MSSSATRSAGSSRSRSRRARSVATGPAAWFAGERLPRSPFEQAADSRHALVRKLRELPDWPAGLNPIAGQAVAFPDVELDSMAGRLGLLGPDVDVDLIADQSTFLDTEDGRRELRDFLDRAFELWSGRAETRPPGRQGVDLLVATLTEPLELRSMLRNEIAGGEREVVRLTEGQYGLLNTLRAQRRAAIVGGAGTGKTMLAAEKARRLATQGYRTLLVCFNSPLAAMLSDVVEAAGGLQGLLEVKTFHQLCEDLGREAGVLPPRPTPPPQEWWDRTLPRALDEAAEQLHGRYHAIVVDEGQDFDPEWLASLEALLVDGRDDVLYVFHDPAQAIYRDDAVAQLGLPTYPLETNCRNAQPIHAVVARLSEGGLVGEPLRTDGRAPEFIEAGDGPPRFEALRTVLHRLRVEERVSPWDIAVLTGARLEESAVWLAPGRRFGNEVLGNPAVDDAGHHLGQAAHLVPDLADDVILCDTVRRFKGLERPVVILVELRADDPRLARLLYVGASRARQHLIVIGSAGVLQVLGAKVAQDPMTADAAPADRGLTVQVDPLEGGAAIGAGERPRHLEQPRRRDDRLDPKAVGKRRRGARTEGVAGRVELFDARRLPEHLPLALGQPPVVALEGGRGLVAHGLGAVEVGEELLGGVVDGALALLDVGIDLPLHLLPALRPEPGLVGRDRHGRVQLDDAVIAFDDLDLGARLVDPEPAPDVRRQRDEATLLDRHVGLAVAHELQHISITAVATWPIELEVIHMQTVATIAHPGLIR